MLLNPYRFRSSLLNGLESYWKLDGNSNDAVGSNHGSDTSITYSEGNGKVDQGAGFNGSTSKITMGNVLDKDGSQPFSIAIWFKTSTTGAVVESLVTKAIISGTPYAGYGIQLNCKTASAPDAGKMGMFLNRNDAFEQILVETNSAYNDGAYHLGIGTYDGSKTAAGILLYIDGALAASTSRSSVSFTGSISNAAEFQLGGRHGVNQVINGPLDAAGIWNRVLSSAEVSALYNAGAGIQYPFM